MANENGRNTSSRNTSTVGNKRKVIFVPNVNDVIEKKLHEPSTAAIFKSLVDCVNNRYVTIFSRSMQDYVQRFIYFLGIKKELAKQFTIISVFESSPINDFSPISFL